MSDSRLKGQHGFTIAICSEFRQSEVLSGIFNDDFGLSKGESSEGEGEDIYA